MTHVNHLLLVHAANKAEAREKVNAFMQPYYSDREDNDSDHRPVWDWFRFGGRFAWFLETEKGKAIQKQIDDGKGFYKDQHAIALDYAVKQMVDKEYESEILSYAELEKTKPKSEGAGSFFDSDPFFRLIQDAQDSIYREIGWCMVQSGKRNDKRKKWSMDTYYAKKAKDLATGKMYHFEAFFFDIQAGTWELADSRFKEIRADPEHWFLANLDLHN